MLSSFSLVQLFATPWTAAHQAPLSLGLFWQEYGHGLSFPSSGDLPDWGIELASLTSPALTGRFFTTSTIREGLVSSESGLVGTNHVIGG